MFLLGIETSSARGSLALLDAAGALTESVFPEGLVHARELTVHLDALLRRAGLGPTALTAIAVGLGPGSFTGIRVGVTAAKSLAFALRIPVIGESSLRVIAAGAALQAAESSPAASRDVVALVDGKQRCIYAARFRVAMPSDPGGFRVERLSDDAAVELPRATDGDEVSARARAHFAQALGFPPAETPQMSGPPRDWALVGDGALPARSFWGLPAVAPERGDDGWPSAAVLVRLVAPSLSSVASAFDVEAVHRLSPLYLRPSEAERKLGGAA